MGVYLLLQVKGVVTLNLLVSQRPVIAVQFALLPLPLQVWKRLSEAEKIKIFQCFLLMDLATN